MAGPTLIIIGISPASGQPITPNQSVIVTIAVVGGVGPYTISVNWGDGNPQYTQVPGGNIVQGQQYQLIHPYTLQGGPYTIQISGFDSLHEPFSGSILGPVVYQSGGGGGGGGSPPPNPGPSNPISTPLPLPGGGSVPFISNQTQPQVSPPININAPNDPPNIPVVFSRNTAQSGPTNNKTSITCAIANAKLIMKKAAKGIMPANPSYGFATEPAGGFFSVLPVSGPDNINNQLPISGAYGSGFFLTDQNGNPRNMNSIRPANMLLNNVIGSLPGQGAGASASASASSMITEPLFNGILHILYINFNNGSNNQMNMADFNTIVAFINAIAPIQIQYANQWGACSMKIDPTIYNVTLTLPSGATTFNDGNLAGTYGSTPGAGFIDTVAQTLGFQSGGPSAHAFIVICPPGITNTDCDPTKGYLAYHSSSAVNVIPYIYLPIITTGLTSNDSQDAYQIPCSHEIAEMSVDPTADLNNPEVCDSCGPNCQTVIRNFFDSNGNYIVSSSIFTNGSPGFTYAIMSNAVSAPPYATTSGNTCPMVPYNYCAYAPSGAAAPLNQFSIESGIDSLLEQLLIEGIVTLNFPGGTSCQGQLVQLASGAIILQLPMGGPH
jgi:hypothetical protein